MRTFRPRRTDALRMAMLLACALPSLYTPSPALAQDVTGKAAAPPLDAVPRGASAAIESESNAAIDRLQHAVSGSRGSADQTTVPALPTPGDQRTREITEALHSQAADQAMERRSKSAFDAAREAMEREREVMAARLGQALGLTPPDTAALAKGVIPAAAKGRVVVLFVSSSMPVSTLRAYAAQLEKVGGVLAFRGMPGGLSKVAPMARLSAQVLRIDPGCEGPACAMRDVQVIVDPIAFRAHGVTRVPALAMIPGDPARAYCEREDDSPTSAHLISGDASLSGLLEEYARLGGQEEVRDAQARLDRR